MSVWAWLAVAALGAVASAARFSIHSLLLPRAAGSFPRGTLLVNVSGSLLLGLIDGLAVGGTLLVLTGTATLGSFTTFSTWMLETRELTEENHALAALMNVVLSVAVGLAAVALGHALGRQL